MHTCTALQEWPLLLIYQDQQNYIWMRTTEGQLKHDYVKEMYYAAGRGTFTAYEA